MSPLSVHLWAEASSTYFHAVSVFYRARRPRSIPNYINLTIAPARSPAFSSGLVRPGVSKRCMTQYVIESIIDISGHSANHALGGRRWWEPTKRQLRTAFLPTHII